MDIYDRIIGKEAVKTQAEPKKPVKSNKEALISRAFLLCIGK